jgi:pantoate--beta-alanine ligase
LIDKAEEVGDVAVITRYCGENVVLKLVESIADVRREVTAARGSGEDLARYPRTLESDLAKCEAAGVDLVFAPSESTIYPRGRSATFVEVPGLSHMLEGTVRPGHFRGVASVVLALFEIVRPDFAVFGQKDYQQQLLIRRMVEDLHVPVEILIEPTVRVADVL